ADYRVLRAQLISDYLERSAHVVIEPSHKPRSERVFDLALIQKSGELREVISARIAQRIRYYRQFRQKRLAGFDLAVQNPQRICLVTLLTTSTKVRKYFTNGFFELR